MKNMSFGKLMAIFGGVFVVVIIALIVIIKMINGQKQSASVVTHRQQQPAAAAAAAEQKPETVNVNEQLKTQQDLQSVRAASAAQAQAVQQAVQQGNTVVIQRMDGLATDVAALAQRIAALEEKRAAIEMVVKPPRKPKTSAIKQLAEGATPLSTSSGYKVQSTVDSRAWVEAGDNSDSVAVGEALPPVATKRLRVRAVDADSGIVITTHDR